MTTILAAIVLFGVLITVHELGHFLAAKGTGMLVTEFSIGFGPKLIQKKVGETLYSLRLCPLGGYNRIAGMEPGEAVTPRGFNGRPLWARMLVILAGPFMNFLLPFLLFFGIFAVSGLTLPVNKPVVGSLMEGYPGAAAGLQAGDRLVSINGRKLEKWNDINSLVQENGPKPGKVVIRRDGREMTLTLQPRFDGESKRFLIGVRPPLEHRQLSLWESLKTAGLAVGKTTVAMVDGLRKMITGKVRADIAGPIGVAHMAGDVAAQGAVPYLEFMAFLSLNLAVLNLVPIPALDGGQFLVLVVEGLLGHALAPKAKEIIQMIGVACIVALTIFATMHDLLQ
ncbi:MULTISPECIES: RIP metalloprotease RseP [Acidaminococcus]|uniref:Zinc metalloprotease n=1 Tax=Acidaminococcus fermentans TaxID=905 RepID=A0A6N7VY03_ACIFE|nr:MULTISPECIES: RIP metalloprotease RseP [Acidaminococcus]MEE1598848.1 RIP metalloprotease RseP [Acidaminococcus fermentans]MEE4123110.1 RIP metalloprotease RseP [Acidaminococcus fermentans]MSS81093.1 RIP metalloprotease RseP [Acidaminococcus fermentans]CDE94684.1 membrane-associated zinc metalloprotease [Acidaminococcus sp. CAG:542]